MCNTYVPGQEDQMPLNHSYNEYNFFQYKLTLNLSDIYSYNSVYFTFSGFYGKYKLYSFPGKYGKNRLAVVIPFGPTCLQLLWQNPKPKSAHKNKLIGANLKTKWIDTSSMCEP